ncbi:hypothetical protein [Xylanibacter brevis]|uniref:hypothetical protein n=1 Tax=Xylanibacter brevis TaxID=83231 RepID=UPI0012DF560D|nr:hypothetical protein [Xylanibacter brevis]
MKQILLLFTLFFISSAISAQKENDFFTCPEFKADIQEYNKTTKGSNKKRCQMLMKLNHMNDDGEIEYQYVFHAKDTLDKTRLMEIIRRWAKTNFKNYERSTISETDSTAEYTGYFMNVGQVMGAFKAVVIHGISYVTIETKADRIRVTAKVRHYTLAQGSVGGAKNVLTLPRDVYPYTDSSNQSTYAQAYINCNFKLILTVGDIMLYLNKNYPEFPAKEKKNDDW